MSKTVNYIYRRTLYYFFLFYFMDFKRFKSATCNYQLINIHVDQLQCTTSKNLISIDRCQSQTHQIPINARPNISPIIIALLELFSLPSALDARQRSFCTRQRGHNKENLGNPRKQIFFVRRKHPETRVLHDPASHDIFNVCQLIYPRASRLVGFKFVPLLLCMTSCPPISLHSYHTCVYITFSFSTYYNKPSVF